MHTCSKSSLTGKKITYALRRPLVVDVDGFEPPTLCL